MKKTQIALILSCAALSQFAMNASAGDIFNPEQIQPKLIEPQEKMGYLANLYIANNLFDMRFRNHVGESQYIDGLTGQKHSTSLWVHSQYGFTEFKGGDGQLKSHSNTNAVQFGADIIQWQNSNDYRNTFHLGLTAGRGESKNTLSSEVTGRTGDSKVEGWAYGVYATWAENQEMRRGLFVDASVLWNDLNGSVESSLSDNEYKLRGIVASIDSGYAFEVGQMGDYAFLIEPQAQFTYQGVKAHDSVDSQGTRISSNHGNLRSRLGVRMALQNDYDAHANGAQVYVEGSWINNTRNYKTTFNDENELTQDSVKNIGELRIGVEGYVIRNLYVWFNIAGQKGNNDYKNVAMALGLQYYFK